MIYLIVALQAEARPFIEYFQLKQQHNPKWRVYQNEELILVVSGTGKIRAAMAATYLYSSSRASTSRSSLTMNVGLCGSTDPNAYQRGDLVVVNQVLDSGNKRRYFPDMLLRHDSKEAGVETFDRPVMDKNAAIMPLVDMEAAGFFEAAGIYFSPDRVLCVKIVSDYLDAEHLAKTTITKLFDARLDDIAKLLKNLKQIHPTESDILSEANQNLITALSQHLKLSVTQQHQLKSLAQGHVIRNNNNLDFLREFLTKGQNSKYEAKQCFNTIKSILGQP